MYAFDITSMPCPAPLVASTNPPGCGRSASVSTDYIRSITIPVNGPWTEVQGKITGYGRGTPDGFAPMVATPSRFPNGAYVDGFSITTASVTRVHIYTLAVGNTPAAANNEKCPCAPQGPTLPDVGVPLEYQCQQVARSSTPTAVFDASTSQNGCTTVEQPGSFHVVLAQPSTDDIEIRVMADQSSSNEEIYLSSVVIEVR